MMHTPDPSRVNSELGVLEMPLLSPVQNCICQPGGCAQQQLVMSDGPDFPASFAFLLHTAATMPLYDCDLLTSQTLHHGIEFMGG